MVPFTDKEHKEAREIGVHPSYVRASNASQIAYHGNHATILDEVVAHFLASIIHQQAVELHTAWVGHHLTAAKRHWLRALDLLGY